MTAPDARRRAEEALAEWKRAWILGCAATPAGVATAAIALKSGLEALLAAGPGAKAPGYDRIAELEQLRAAATYALAVLTRLADSAAYWSDYDVPIGLIAEIDEAKARLAGALSREARP